MSKRGESILKGLKEAVLHRRGALKGARVHTFTAMDVARIRKSTGLSQRRFSEAFHIPLPTLRNWEQGKRVPQGPAAVLLRVIEKNPRAVFDMLE